MKQKHAMQFRIAAVLLYVVSLQTPAAQLELTLKDSQGNLQQDAVVALIPVKKEIYTDSPTVAIDQVNKQFIPNVMAIRVNTQVRFPNSDDIRHHVYSFSPAKKFELRLYHGTPSEPVLFDQPGTIVLGCNIHDSMVGYIFVVDSQYFAKADMQGVARIANIPAGEYQLEIYHPRMNGNYPPGTISFSEQENKQDTRVLNNLSITTTNKPDDEFSNLF